MSEKRDDETVTQFTMRKIREEIIEECARAAEDTAPIAAGNFFAARRDQCAKIAAKIRALSKSPAVGKSET